MRPARLSVLFSLALSTLLYGCSSPVAPFTNPSQPAVTITGKVQAGQQAVSGATIQLYTVGTTADGSAATPLLTSTVTTDASGNFALSGLYSCSQATQVYVTAVGGNPGLSAANPNLAEMTAIGPCSSLTPNTLIFVNELTTIAATSALAPYATSAPAIGSSSADSTALASAFTLAGELVNTVTGTTPGTAVPAGSTVPISLIDTLGNIISGCTHSAGGATSGSTCTAILNLTTPPNSKAPSDTLQALFNIANNPTLNIGPLFALDPPTAPFQPQLASAPADFAIKLMPLISSSTLTITPSSLAFSATTLGSVGPAATVSITNPGTTAVALSSVAIAGVNSADFTQTNTCGTSIAGGATCQALVTFAPAATGTRNASLVFTSSATGSPQTVALTGTGAAATVGPIAFSLPSLSYNVDDSIQDVNLQNLGNVPLTISSIATDNTNFEVESSNCGTTLAAQSVCTISVRTLGFLWSGSTTLYSTYTGNLIVNSNASAGPQTLPLSSTNTLYLPAIPADFGASPVGITQTSGTITASPGSYYESASLSTSIGGANASDFAVSPASCNVPVSSVTNCSLAISFTPSASGTRSAMLYVATGNDSPNSATNKQYLRLSGIGNTTGPSFAVTYKSSTQTRGYAILNTAGTASNTDTYTVLNTGSTIISLSAALTGSAAADYTSTNNCVSISPSSSCTLNVVFTGSSVGTFPATLTLTDTVSTSSQPLQLSTLVQYPTPVPSPYSTDFGTQPLNIAATRNVFITSGTYGSTLEEPVTASITTGSGVFSLPGGSTCPASTSQTCTLTVAFTPTAVGNFTGTLTLTGQTSGNQANYPLSGGGGVATLALSPASLTFPVRTVGTTSTPMNVTVSSTAALSLNISSITITGVNSNDFTQTNNCTAVTVSSTCTIAVTFTPTAIGTSNANLVLTSNATGSPQTVPLTGTSAAATVGPIAYSLASLSYTVDGSIQDVNLQNLGSAPLTISSIATDNTNFKVESNTCGTMLAAQSVCTISVSTGGFNIINQQYSTYTGNLVVSDNATAGPQTLPLSSTNTISISTVPTDFGAWPINTTRTGGIITANTGSYYTSDALLAAVGGTNASDFAVSPSGCSIQANTSPSNCSLAISFTPSATGTRSAKLYVSNASGTPNSQYFRLSGTGDATGPSFVLTYKSSTGSPVLNTSGTAFYTNTYTVLNNGTTTLTLSGIVSGPAAANYSSNSNCSSIAPNNSCTLNVTFNGASHATYLATLTLSDSFSSYSQPLQLSTVVQYPTPILSPNSLTFSAQPLNTTTTQSLTISSGTYGSTLEEPVTAALDTSSIYSNAFSLPAGSTCPASTSQTCTLTVAFTPTAAANGVNGSVIFTGQISGNKAYLALYGIAGSPALSLSPTSLTFPARALGTTSVPMNVTVSNTGTLPLNISSITVTGANISDFTQTNNCSTVAVGSTCTVAVSFTPGATGSGNASLVLTSNAPGSPQTVALTGTGAAATVGPVTFNFSSLSYTVGNSIRDVKLQNLGSTPLTITGIATDNTNFKVESNTCGTTLLAQSLCTISVQTLGFGFSGITLNYTSYTGNLVVTDNATSGPQTLPLTSTNTVEVGATADFGAWPVETTHTGVISSSSGTYYQSSAVSFVLGGINASDFGPSGGGCYTTALQNSSCSENLSFTPSATGVRSAVLYVNSSNLSADASQYFRISGTGDPVGPSFIATYKSSTQSRGRVVLTTAGSATNTDTYTILNNGSTTLTLSGMASGSAAANYSSTSNCASIAAGSSCAFSVTFTGTSIGTFPATLTISDSLSSYSQSLPVSTTVVYPTPTPSSSSLNFNAQPLNSTTTMSATISSGTYGSTLEEPVTATFMSNSSSFFSLTNGSTCPAGTSQVCTLTVAFTPTAVGYVSGAIILTGQTSGNQGYLNLYGIGGLPALSLSPTSLTFPARSVGTTSVPMNVTVSNTGNQPLNINSINVIGATNNNFTQTNNCTQVAAGSACTIGVTFAPTASGSQAASIRIISNASTSPDTITLSGSTN
ncbi:choice-of-anchor D domain-containing protein [Granulicella tundricola]|uniref:HYDIN/VesB/CFA65-like Ig-like domain-containing protein n=1 Tax=Granulicella tundricola (strain ATCC BAA-1859 / DSM 23138 / MP5ACTX9) TaxID=1198114 RepID=E8X541_GRATM|nr:choice-of-anchor D domain-containing protein [Granulicella tundricola]ADW68305.1 hypothetical protein AciX9_1242 [Granulicella tundricola MP5ACTX9]